MDDMLSQEEINALLKGLDTDDEPESSAEISPDEKDAIGEVSNISMGTAATTLFSLVNQKVLITTPSVSISKWSEVVEEHREPCVAIQIVYKEGLDGTNLLILKENDVKIIADLMMGGDGSNPDAELNDLHLSAIGEAMNQMIGSAATSMSSMFHKKIDIAPPITSQINLTEAFDPAEVSEFLAGDFIKVSFSLQIGDLVDSEMMQIYPIEFAKDIYSEFVSNKEDETPEASGPLEEKELASASPENLSMDMGQGMPINQQGMNQQGMNQQGMNQQGMNQMPMNQGMGMNQMPMNQGMGMNQTPMNQGMGMNQMPMNQGMGMNQMPMNQGNMAMNNVEVQQAQFQNFDVGAVMQQKENIDLIMDVQLEVTVELGRTHKSIKDVLEFAPGTIIELNKLSGEPIDVLVNGKIVAKGEVVVIDENFSIRVTDIVKDKYSE